jgi:hypothetical protein
MILRRLVSFAPMRRASGQMGKRRSRAKIAVDVVLAEESCPVPIICPFFEERRDISWPPENINN